MYVISCKLSGAMFLVQRISIKTYDTFSKCITLSKGSLYETRINIANSRKNLFSLRAMSFREEKSWRAVISMSI